MSTVLEFQSKPPGEALQRLSARVRRDLAYLEYPTDRKWTLDRVVEGQSVLDVLIIGGGQTGLTVAFALRQERVSNIRIVDRAKTGREGPWTTYARMPNLRTPKAVTGPDLGIPSLTPRAWFEARFGEGAWDRIETVPRTAWHEYLTWYRDILELNVDNETAALAVLPFEDLLKIELTGPRGAEIVYARKVVLATGLEGSGIWRLPEIVTANLPCQRYAHAADAIDFAALRGKRVAILGAGASAFDNAGTALEHSAAHVDMFVRRTALPNVNALYWMNFTGVLANFGDMPDLQRWRFGRRLARSATPPPPSSVARCVRHPNFALRLGEPWREVIDRGAEGFVASTAKGDTVLDFVICATGADPDPRQRPELSSIANHIALWRDRFTPPDGEASELLASYPYLGAAFEFTELNPGTAPWLRHIHNFNFGAVASMGNVGGAPSLRFGVPRLVNGIVRDLFVGDANAYLADFESYDTPEPFQIHW